MPCMVVVVCAAIYPGIVCNAEREHVGFSPTRQAFTDCLHHALLSETRGVRSVTGMDGGGGGGQGEAVRE